MENNLLTILALIWVIYTFLFAEADRQLSELFKRLKFSLAFNDKGVFLLTQFQAKQHLGIPEVIDLGKKLGDHINSKLIHKFQKKYEGMNRRKMFLIWNLFLLSINIILLNLFEVPVSWIDVSKLHAVISLLLSLAFYDYVNKLSEVKFTEVFVKNGEAEETASSSQNSG